MSYRGEIDGITFYLSSPGNQKDASFLSEMPVLLSFATWKPWLESYVQSFGRILIDSGAFTELNSGKVIDGAAYKDWYQAKWVGHADGIAGLDDIRGDWRRSLRNYELYGGFPTYHETDPPELLDDLIPIARAQGGSWIGLGLLPPRNAKDEWVKRTLDRLPPDLHVHGFALRGYAKYARLNSADSINWVLDSWAYRKKLPFLTPAECLELVVKRYRRWRRPHNEDDGWVEEDYTPTEAEIEEARQGKRKRKPKKETTAV